MTNEPKDPSPVKAGWTEVRDIVFMATAPALAKHFSFSDTLEACPGSAILARIESCTDQILALPFIASSPALVEALEAAVDCLYGIEPSAKFGEAFHRQINAAIERGNAALALARGEG
jgi:hypothetical protein